MHPNNRPIILTLMLTIVIDIMGIGLVFPLFPDLFLSGHSVFVASGATELWRDSAYAIAMGVWPLGLFFGSPFAGDVSDKIGRRKTLLIFLSLTAVGYAFGAVAIMMHNLWLFVFSRFMSGFVGGAFEIAQAAVADISHPDHKAKNIGYLAMAASLGFVIGPVIASLATSGWLHFSSLQLPFWIAAVLSVLNACSIALLLRESYQPQTRAKLNILKAFAAVSFLFQDKRIRVFGVIFVLLQAGWGFYIQAVPVVVHHWLSYESSMIGLFFAASGAGVVFTSGTMQPWLLKRFTLKGLYVSSAILTTLILLFGFCVHLAWAQWLVVVTASMVELMCYTTLITILSHTVSEHEQGKVMGSAGAGFGLSWAINALLLSVLLSWFVAAPMLIGLILIVTSGVIMIFKKVTV